MYNAKKKKVMSIKKIAKLTQNTFSRMRSVAENQRKCVLKSDTMSRNPCNWKVRFSRKTLPVRHDNGSTRSYSVMQYTFV